MPLMFATYFLPFLSFHRQLNSDPMRTHWKTNFYDVSSKIDFFFKSFRLMLLLKIINWIFWKLLRKLNYRDQGSHNSNIDISLSFSSSLFPYLSTTNMKRKCESRSPTLNHWCSKEPNFSFSYGKIHRTKLVFDSHSPSSLNHFSFNKKTIKS